MGGRVDESCVLVDGPWTHRFVGANGSRFHVVEAGTGPWNSRSASGEWSRARP